MNIFFRIFIILIPLGVAIFVILFRFQSEKEQPKTKDGQAITRWKEQLQSKALQFAVVAAVIIVLLLLLNMIIDNNRLQALRDAYKLREEKLEEVYALENGQEIPRDLVNYSWDAPSPILPGDALSEEEFLPIKVRSGSVLFVKGKLVGGAWQDNCGHPPVVKLSSYTPGGTKQTPGDYIIFTDDNGRFAATVQLAFGGKPGLVAGCPTATEWIKLDYEITLAEHR